MEKTFKCRVCGIPKDGTFRSMCKKCEREYKIEWSKRNKEHKKLKHHQWYLKVRDDIKFKRRIRTNTKKLRDKNRDYYNFKSKLYKINNIQKHKSRYLAYNHIKIPIGYICDLCKNDFAIQRHHEDYSKPLEVQLLCKNCHDKKNRKYKEVSISQI